MGNIQSSPLEKNLIRGNTMISISRAECGFSLQLYDDDAKNAGGGGVTGLGLDWKSITSPATIPYRG